jgi:YD repeat-containing protein
MNADGRIWFYDYDTDGRANQVVTADGDIYRVDSDMIGNRFVSRVHQNGKLIGEIGYSETELDESGNYELPYQVE